MTRFYPFGSYRRSDPAFLTERGFTGHKQNDSLGLIYMNARYYVGSIGRFASADTIVPNPANPQSFNRYSYARNNPLRFTDPTGHRECDDGPDNCSPYTSLFEMALLRAWEYYEDNFVKPFEGKQSLTQEFGPTQWSDFHDGVDWGGDFTVRAPASGTVTEAGPDAPAGRWRLQNKDTLEVRQWLTLKEENRGDDGLLEPERLLATGEWRDDAPDWSHTRGTIISIDHGHNLETVYYHTDPAVIAGTTVNQGEVLGVTANNGWSTGTHLHYTVLFTYNSTTLKLNPLAPPAIIQHLLTP
jgi:RHS repeat-associated protein